MEEVRRRPPNSAKKPIGLLDELHFSLLRPNPAASAHRASLRTRARPPILEGHGERMIRRTFDPGFRIELYHKDLNLALTSARQTGVSLPNRATAQERFTPARRMAVR